jgi:gas vesicle protein
MSSRFAKVVIATAAGFAAGILLAPKSGAATRKELKYQAKRSKDYFTGKTDEAKEVAERTQDALRQSIGDASDEAVELAKSARVSAVKVGRQAKSEADKLSKEAKTRATRVATNAKRTAANTRKDAEKLVR